MYQPTTALKKIRALKKRIKGLQGGTSASKTIGSLMVEIDYAQSHSPKDGTDLTSIVSESMPHLKRGVIRDFEGIMKAHGYWRDENWNKTDKIYTFETGWQIEFFSVDQSDKVRGPRRSRLFGNECNNWKNGLETFNQLEVRTKDSILLDWNPSSEFWWHTDILPNEDLDAEMLIITYKDNEALDPQIVKSIEARKNNKAWWQVYGLGQLGEVEDLIYKGWQVVDEIPYEARLECYGLDFGYRPDATALVAIYSLNGGFIIKEIKVQIEWKLRELATYLHNLEPAIVIADTNEPRSVAELREYNINILETEKGPDSKKHGIKMMQDQKISITKDSVTTLKGYRSWMWKKDRDGKIVPGETEHEPDPLAAARYGIQYLKPFRADEYNSDLAIY